MSNNIRGNMSNNIQGKVVVITGASSGLGEATATHLASLGAAVVLAARRKERLEALASKIRASGGTAEVVETDVTRREEVSALVQAALSRFQRVDVMINNAGLMALAPLDAEKVSEWERMISVNIHGVLYGIAAALPVFRRQKSGHFINLSSVAGLKVFSPGGTVYSATKYAVRAISEGLRQEVGPAIRTTCILPGAIESELKFGTSDEQSQKANFEFYKMAIPPSSVARAVAYAIEQPPDVDITDIVLRPTSQQF